MAKSDVVQNGGTIQKSDKYRQGVSLQFQFNPFLQTTVTLTRRRREDSKTAAAKQRTNQVEITCRLDISDNTM